MKCFSQRDKINLRLQEIIGRQTDLWGIKVTAVEVRDVVLPDSMNRAMAGQADSERERRAKIINAEGEFQAAEKLVQAASMISKQPIALQLRFLQTMKEISSGLRLVALPFCSNRCEQSEIVSLS
jgi:regulator of protease activity HflC (stomatin/prohibitin superfamily)